jgi:hypothetical protein
VRPEGLGKLKKIHLIESRSRDLPACSTVYSFPKNSYSTKFPPFPERNARNLLIREWPQHNAPHNIKRHLYEPIQHCVLSPPPPPLSYSLFTRISSNPLPLHTTLCGSVRWDAWRLVSPSQLPRLPNPKGLPLRGSITRCSPLSSSASPTACMRSLLQWMRTLPNV